MKQLFFRSLLPCLAVLALLGQGCLQTNIIPEPTPAERPEVPPSDDARSPSSDEPARESTYEPFSEAQFEAALAEGLPIYLYFIASWCPTCREQQPRNEVVVPNHHGGISGFYIHILDSETGALEKRYAERYNVTYQHTAIYFRDGQELFRRIGTQSNAQMNADLDRISE